MVPKWYLDQHTPFRCCGCCWPTRTTSEPHWEFHATVPDLLLLSKLVVIIVAGSDSGSGTSAPESKRDADETCSERPALYTTIERSTCGGCTTQQKICELPATVWQFVGGSIKRHFVCWCDEMMTICCVRTVCMVSDRWFISEKRGKVWCKYCIAPFVDNDLQVAHLVMANRWLRSLVNVPAAVFEWRMARWLG